MAASITTRARLQHYPKGARVPGSYSHRSAGYNNLYQSDWTNVAGECIAWETKVYSVQAWVRPGIFIESDADHVSLRNIQEEQADYTEVQFRIDEVDMSIVGQQYRCS